jgi:chemotaxis protein CheZ
MGDNAELQALFEQASAQAQAVLAEVQKPAAPAAKAKAAEPAAAEDDLESLFDQVSSDTWGKTGPGTLTAESVAPAAEVVKPALPDVAPVAAPLPAADDEAGQDADGMFNRIGHLTRTLHDSLRELGYDKAVETAVNALPDTRDRLAYIATLTGKAADRALAAVEAGQVHQARLQEGAAQLAAKWDRVYAGDANVDEFKAVAAATREFLKILPVETGATNAQLTEIMMAQDFHDLTGQVINRVVSLASDMEKHLLSLLLETTPPEKRPSGDEGFLNGPVVNGAGRTDVVANQEQVDDLLESLGF